MKSVCLRAHIALLPLHPAAAVCLFSVFALLGCQLVIFLALSLSDEADIKWPASMHVPVCSIGRVGAISNANPDFNGSATSPLLDVLVAPMGAIPYPNSNPQQ